ncbi:MAG: hypothetical protein M1393_03435 [Candidatus Thermoplasmatota archaeon]|nr:hypothetical protein [Candidatus Thermoplasmatota archaeon]MDA8144173.1 hypothetical protein [Thermoplasmatales archaeon]
MEFGATDFMMKRCSHIMDALKIYDNWESILVFAIFTLLYESPMKRIQFHYET